MNKIKGSAQIKVCAKNPHYSYSEPLSKYNNPKIVIRQKTM